MISTWLSHSPSEDISFGYPLRQSTPLRGKLAQGPVVGLRETLTWIQGLNIPGILCMFMLKDSGKSDVYLGRLSEMCEFLCLENLLRMRNTCSSIQLNAFCDWTVEFDTVQIRQGSMRFHVRGHRHWRCIFYYIHQSNIASIE